MYVVATSVYMHCMYISLHCSDKLDHGFFYAGTRHNTHIYVLTVHTSTVDVMC